MLGHASVPSSPTPSGNKHKHRCTRVGGLTFHPHLTADRDVRFGAGRELSSPTWPSGAKQWFNRNVLCVCILLPGALHLGCFGLFFEWSWEARRADGSISCCFLCVNPLFGFFLGLFILSLAPFLFSDATVSILSSMALPHYCKS